MRIRLATPQDVDALVEIHLRARETYYRGVVPDEERTVELFEFDYQWRFTSRPPNAHWLELDLCD